jgi:hypothetical protein
MRRDLILPALMVIALVVMGVYAMTAEKEKGTSGVDLPTTPVACENARLISRIGVLPEASGLAVSRQNRNVFWSHNDSDDAVLYAIVSDGSIGGRVQLAGASVVDWEAITTSPCDDGNCLYVADIGDNGMNRRSITIYRTREPSPTDRTTAPAARIEAVYPEGAQDAEALFVANRSLYVVTKGEGTPIRVYRVPSGESATPVTLELIATLTAEGARKKIRVTDAAVSPDGAWIALRSNDLVLFYKADALLAGTPQTPLSYDLTPLKEPQGEGIAWADDTTLYLAGEAESGGTFGRLTCSLTKGH